MEYITIDTPMELLSKTMKRGINAIKVLTANGSIVPTVAIDGVKIVVPSNVAFDTFIIKDIVE